jgi:predicted lipid carrier protein YhbT
MGRLPVLPVSVAFTAALNLAAWRGLGELDWGHLRGKRFCVRVKDLGLCAYFSVGERGFVPQVTGTADVTFTASAEDFARLALRLEDPDTLFFNRRLLIEGDTDLGLGVKNLLDGVELETLTARMPAGLGTLVGKLRSLAAGHGAA